MARTHAQTKPKAAPKRPASSGRPIRVEGDPLAGLAAAVDSPPESDRELVQAWSRIRQAREDLSTARKELAAERRRTEILRAELRRLRTRRGR